MGAVNTVHWLLISLYSKSTFMVFLVHQDIYCFSIKNIFKSNESFNPSNNNYVHVVRLFLMYLYNAHNLILSDTYLIRVLFYRGMISYLTMC